MSVFASAGRFGQFVTFKRFHFLGWGEGRINRHDNKSSISFCKTRGVKLESFVLPVSQCVQQSRLFCQMVAISLLYKILLKDTSHLPLLDNCSGENSDFMIIFSCYSFVPGIVSRWSTPINIFWYNQDTEEQEVTERKHFTDKRQLKTPKSPFQKWWLLSCDQLVSFPGGFSSAPLVVCCWKVTSHLQRMKSHLSLAEKSCLFIRSAFPLKSKLAPFLLLVDRCCCFVSSSFGVQRT